MTDALDHFRPVTAPDRAPSMAADLVSLFALDRLTSGRQPLVAHWHLGADGTLTCAWEPD